MPSKREQVLDRLATKLKTLESTSLKVYRNLDKPQQIPSGGMIVLRDGVAGEPEVLLSPLTYIYEQLVTVEVMVQNPDPAARDALLDVLLVALSGVITTNRTLDGLAEWMEARSPEFQDEPIEGAASIRAATVQVMVRFFTSDPLN
jgi:hypothetical protein